LRVLLLSALVKAVGKMKGVAELLIEIASHGREDIFSDLDVSRTIGWFSNNYPVYFSLEGVSSFEQEIFTIRDQLVNIPKNGIGFGLLKYLSKDQEIKNKMQKLPSPTMFFNYLGQFDQSNSEDWVPFRIAKESPGAEQDPQEIRNTLLHGVAIITGGRLQIRWIYSENLYKRGKISKFANIYRKELQMIANYILQRIDTRKSD
jgi:non-ribosomal peptide synthase protein (TIGR01720 family)